MLSGKQKVSALTVLLAISSGAWEAAGAAPRTYNVKNYGAKGDGVTNDTAAIQQAIELAKQGDTVYFPTGTYLYTDTLILHGQNLEGNDVTLSGSTSTLLGGSDLAYVQVEGPSTTIEGLIFDSNGSGTATNTILGISDDNLTIVGNTFKTKAAYPVYLRDIHTGTVRINNFTSATALSTISFVGSNNVLIDNNTIKNSATYSLGENGAGIATHDCTDVTVSRNTVVGGPFFDIAGVNNVNGNKVTVKQNSFTYVTSGVLSGNCVNESVVQNIFVSNFQTAISVRNSSGELIDTNTIRGTARGAVSATNMRDSFTITANQMAELSFGAIHVDGGDKVYIANNIIANAGESVKSTPAVIQADAITNIVSILKNSYSGKANNLKYFIFTTQGAPVANVSGNKTNTLLPNHIGG